MFTRYRSAWATAAVLATCFVVGCVRPPASAVLSPGSPLPKLEAAGWVNGSPPSQAELAGKVVVIDVWAHW